MQGVNNIDSIIAASDGIMVARGDMGVEIDFQRIPAIQKMIIRKVYDAGKIVVTATQMLESMINNPVLQERKLPMLQMLSMTAQAQLCFPVKAQSVSIRLRLFKR